VASYTGDPRVQTRIEADMPAWTLVLFHALIAFPGFALAAEPKHPLAGQEHDPAEDHHMDEVEEHVPDPEDLTPEQLVALHGKIDNDSNGKLSIDEVLGFFHETRKGAAAQDGKMMMDEMDEDKDGKLSLEEVTKDHDAGDEHEGHDPKDVAVREAQERRSREKFEAADINKDGFLDDLELAAYFNPELHDHVLEVVAKHTMDEKDLDKDGFLSHDEFWSKVQAVESDSELEEGEPSVPPTDDDDEKVFKKTDKNGDGKIDLEELVYWEAGHVHTAEAMESFMALADTDSDQHVSIDELHAAHGKDENEAKYHFMEMAQHHEL